MISIPCLMQFVASAALELVCLGMWRNRRSYDYREQRRLMFAENFLIIVAAVTLAFCMVKNLTFTLDTGEFVEALIEIGIAYFILNRVEGEVRLKYPFSDEGKPSR